MTVNTRPIPPPRGYTAADIDAKIVAADRGETKHLSAAERWPSWTGIIPPTHRCSCGKMFAGDGLGLETGARIEVEHFLLTYCRGDVVQIGPTPSEVLARNMARFAGRF